MGKNVLITGSNRGIGKALVEKYAQSGYDIIACARHQEDSFKDYLDVLSRECGVNIADVYFDMENEEQIKSELKAAISKVKKIDILINNAGYSGSSLFPMISSGELKKELQINYVAPILISQMIARVMSKNGGGSIVNIASVSGIRNEEGRLAYGSSKAALIFASKTMSMELARNNIRVNCVSPGFIDTDMWKSRDKNLYDKILSETPAGRQGTTLDVVNMVYYLTSDAASYITGQNIVVDGGRMV